MSPRVPPHHDTRGDFVRGGKERRWLQGLGRGGVGGATQRGLDLQASFLARLCCHHRPRGTPWRHSVGVAGSHDNSGSRTEQQRVGTTRVLARCNLDGFLVMQSSPELQPPPTRAHFKRQLGQCRLPTLAPGVLHSPPRALAAAEAGVIPTPSECFILHIHTRGPKHAVRAHASVNLIRFHSRSLPLWFCQVSGGWEQRNRTASRRLDLCESCRTTPAIGRTLQRCARIDECTACGGAHSVARASSKRVSKGTGAIAPMRPHTGKKTFRSSFRQLMSLSKERLWRRQVAPRL